MNRYTNIIAGLLSVTLGTVAGGCATMHEDVEECPTGLYVRFAYDYNTARADMFKDHVGHIRLYVYDEAGDKVAQRDVSNTATEHPLEEYGYAVHFADGELPDGRYRLQAVAMQKDWTEAEATPGAKYRRNDPQRHDQLTVHLDRDESPIPGHEHFRVSNEAPLDTLWHTLKVTSTEPMESPSMPGVHKTVKPYSIYPLEEQMVEVRYNHATYATVSLIRNTKHINVILRQLDEPENIYHDDYKVFIVDANRAVGHDNESISDEKLCYSPYHTWTTAFDADGTEINPGTRAESGSHPVNRAAHYNLMCNRLIDHTGDYGKNARLVIYNARTGDKTVDINLPSTLAEGRHAYDTYNYSSQEYLDREYDYHLHFFLKGDKWEYCDVVINVLGWSRRVSRINLD